MYPFLIKSPREGPGVSRECVLRKWGGVSESPYKKGGPVSVLGRAR